MTSCDARVIHHVNERHLFYKCKENTMAPPPLLYRSLQLKQSRKGRSSPDAYFRILSAQFFWFQTKCKLVSLSFTFLSLYRSAEGSLATRKKSAPRTCTASRKQRRSWLGSNQRPFASEANALSTVQQDLAQELPHPILAGIEPATLRLGSVRTIHCATGPPERRLGIALEAV